MLRAPFLPPPSGPLRRMISLAIIEDNRLVREGLSAILGGHSDLTVGYAGPEADLDHLRRASPGVILLDLGLEADDSLELVQRLRTELPDARVIVMDLIPVHEDLVQLVNAGVAGFILKDATLKDLLGTIRSVAGGEKVLPPQMTSSLFSQIAEAATQRSRMTGTEGTGLTRREREVVELIGDGLSNKAIAKAIGISPHTVKSHVRNIMDKLALHTRLEIAAFLHDSEDEGSTG